ncbi:MAG: helix-turn-helix domain-containing protein [Rhodocyclaceae bacterium]|nr:helix-turn-helix domain-containing protein [Rhodocyclaceae bacterium]
MARAHFELRSYNAEDRSHAHTFHQLVLPLAGTLEMEVSSHAGRVDASQGVIVVAGERHGFRAVGENRFLVIDLPEVLDALPPDADAVWDRAVGAPYFPIDPDLEHLIRYLRAEMARTRPGEALAHHWIHLFLLSLAERLDRKHARIPARIRQALNVIHAHYAAPLTAADVAAAVNLSPGHLREVFRACMGQTLHDYLSDYRLDQAMQLLASPEPGIAEIAQRCGFSDQSALTRSLKRRRGITPGDYRNAVCPRWTPSGP